MTPDGLKAYVSNHGDETVSVIDTVNRTVTATIQVGVGGPQEITITPDGGRVFVVHQDSGDVAVIDTATDTLIRTVTIGGTGAKMSLRLPTVGSFTWRITPPPW
jgi:YVTN family beta-propeller protein